MRWQRTTDPDGTRRPGEHAHTFLSLRRMEVWRTGHATNAATFGAAITRDSTCSPANQLRTWHEVLVPPKGGQWFE